MIGSQNNFGEVDVPLKASFPNHCLSDIMNASVHPHSLIFYMTILHDYFLATILNGEPIDLGGMIFRTIILHSSSTPHITLHQPWLISRYDESFF